MEYLLFIEYCIDVGDNKRRNLKLVVFIRDLCMFYIYIKILFWFLRKLEFKNFFLNFWFYIFIFFNIWCYFLLLKRSRELRLLILILFKL